MSANDEIADQPQEVEQEQQIVSEEVFKIPINIEEVEETIEDMKFRFRSCGLCSLFLSSAIIIIGDNQFQVAVANMENGWITLPWNKALMRLVDKCFDIQVDIDAYLFEGCCPQCYRPYRFVEIESDKYLEFLAARKK